MELGTPLLKTGRLVINLFGTIFLLFGIGHRVCPLPLVVPTLVCFWVEVEKLVGKGGDSCCRDEDFVTDFDCEKCSGVGGVVLTYHPYWGEM
jgi:hypothetical protein